MLFGAGCTYLVQVLNCCTSSKNVSLSSVTLLSGCGQFLLPAYIGFFLYCMWAKKAQCCFFDVCVLDGNFEVSCGLEGCAHCSLKGILIGNFKNRMFVILQGRSGPVPKKNSGNFVLKNRVFCTSTPWLRPSEKAGVLNIDFCSKISKNSWQEVAAHSGLIVTKACSHSGETVISKTHGHFLWQKLIVSCVCELECFVCSGLWNEWVWKCTQGLH